MTETATQPSPELKTPKAKRRWLQFNLRTLLVLTLVVGSGLGWVMFERRKNARILANREALNSFGCDLTIGRDDSFLPRRFDWLLGRKDLGIVTWMHCRKSTITDAGLVHLKGLTKLEYLHLSGTAVSDAGLVHLKGLTKLKQLNLSSTAITDAGLVHLKGLTELKFLYLSDTAITGAGLAHLKGLTELKCLILIDTAITNAGLAHLKGLTKLDSLDIRLTKVTKSGIADLKKAFPSCHIIHDE